MIYGNALANTEWTTSIFMDRPFNVKTQRVHDEYEKKWQQGTTLLQTSSSHGKWGWNTIYKNTVINNNNTCHNLAGTFAI